MHLYHSITKYIDVRFHWIWDIIGKSLRGVKKVHITKNLLDILTMITMEEKIEL